jgi:hypothetical protein
LSASDNTVQKALDTLDDHAHASTELSVTTTGFDGVLSAADDTVQKALVTIDDHSHVSTAAYGSIPAAAKAGRLFLPSDGFTLWRDTGSVWAPFGPVYPFTKPSAASNWTLRQTAANGSLVDSKGGLYLSATSRVTTDDVIIADVAIPAATYTVIAAFVPLLDHDDVFQAGLAVYEVATGKAVTYTMYVENGLLTLGWDAQATFTTASTSSDAILVPHLNASLVWLKMVVDGSNRAYSYSLDGQHWKQWTSHAKTTGFTTNADRVGLAINANGTAGGLQLLSWSLA